MSKTPTQTSVDFINQVYTKFLAELVQWLESDKGNKYTTHHFYQVEGGLKFDRIIIKSATVSNVEWRMDFPQLTLQEYLKKKEELTTRGGSVYAFIERATKKLVKAAGIRQPAKLSNGQLQSKYNLSDDTEFRVAVADADPHGAFLYLR
jgi:hypothetical protein